MAQPTTSEMAARLAEFLAHNKWDWKQDLKLPAPLGTIPEFGTKIAVRDVPPVFSYRKESRPFWDGHETRPAERIVCNGIIIDADVIRPDGTRVRLDGEIGKPAK